MSLLDLLIITLFFAGYATLRFGVPLLIMWSIRQVASRVTPAQT